MADAQCRACGATLRDGARFCHVCGTPVGMAVRGWHRLVVIGLGAALVLALGVVGYRWVVRPAPDPAVARVEQARAVGDSGGVGPAAAQDRLAAVADALAAAGIRGVALSFEDGVVVRGTLDSAADEAVVRRLIAEQMPAGTPVRMQHQRSAAWIAADATRAAEVRAAAEAERARVAAALNGLRQTLAAAGLKSVTVAMPADGRVALSGTVARAEERQQAEALVRGAGLQPGRNRIRVTGAAEAPPVVAEAAPAVLAEVPAVFLGEWSAVQADNRNRGIVINIAGGRLGDVVGQASYARIRRGGQDMRVDCTMDLILTDATADLLVLDERLAGNRRFGCPGSRVLRLRYGNGAVNGQWLAKTTMKVDLQQPLNRAGR